MSEALVPLNDGKRVLIKKSSSFGSDKDLSLHHEGEKDTLEYRIHAKAAEGKTISLWHDISLVHIDPETGKDTPYYNFVCEIPKFTR
jgi:inorganic pyrophosphatase